MKISGFSFIRNGIKLGYPFMESMQSILPICDEFIIVVGNSNDGTKEMILNLKEQKIKVIDSIWDDNNRILGSELAHQTNIALEAMTGDWGFYLQGDEIIHEDDLACIKLNMELELQNPKIQGLLFSYLHFYGNYNYVGDSKKWYRNEIRIIKNNLNIRSYKDAQGFRLNNKKLNVKKINANVFHYGWSRPPFEQQLKQKAFQKLYNNDDKLIDSNTRPLEFDYKSNQKLALFKGTHPKYISEKIKKVNWDFNYNPKLIREPISYKLISWFEKLTGYRLFEYKNYKIIK